MLTLGGSNHIHDRQFTLPNRQCKNSMTILTNKNGYLSCTFVFSTLGTEQRYKECVRCVGYQEVLYEELSGRVSESSVVY